MADNKAFRRDSLARVLGSALAPAGSYSVTVYAPGARVNGNQTSATPTVDAGHGFPSGSTLDCIVVRSGAMVAGTFVTCAYLSSTSVTLGSSLTLLDGDYIVNLGNDTGTTSPVYDGSTKTIYSDFVGADTIANATVTSNASGEYEYWHDGGVWELVRSGSTVVDLVTGPGTVGAWGGTAAQIKVGESLLRSDFACHGININKASTIGVTHGVTWSRDGNTRWAIGEDYQTGDRSYFAMWGDRANFTAGSVVSSDFLAVAPAISDTAAVDGPKWYFNSGLGAAPYDGNFQFEFTMPSKRSSGTGLFNAWFGNYATATIPSGGIYILASGSGGNRPGITIVQNGTTGGRQSYIAAGKGGATGYDFGVDRPKADTQNWSIFDNAASAYVFYIDATGHVGVGPGNTSPTHFLDLAYTQDAATRCQVSNQSTGVSGRAGVTCATGTTTFNADVFSSGFTTADLRLDAMIYTSGAGAMLHFGTGGAKRMTLLDSAAKLGIGVDPPTQALDVVGSGQFTTGIILATGAAPTVAANQVGFGATVAATATNGTGEAMKANVEGYLVVNVAGTTVKVPYVKN